MDQNVHKYKEKGKLKYHYSQICYIAEYAAKRESEHIVATQVYICHKGLPSSSNSNTYQTKTNIAIEVRE